MRAELVEATLRAIDEHGPDLSIDDVVKTAGIPRPKLYRFFDDKDALFGAVALGVLRWLNGPAISENALVEELTTFVWGAMSATAAAGGRSRSRRASGVAGELTSGLTCARIALACNRSGHSATAYRRGEQQCPRDPQSAFGSCAPVSPPLNMGPGAGSGPDHQIAIIGARPGGICADDRKQPKAKARKASGAG